jgi:hypothetical protein
MVEVPTVAVLAVKYVVVAPRVVRLVNDAVRAERSEEKYPVVVVELVMNAFVA